MWIHIHGDDSWEPEKAKNHTGWDLASMVHEMTVNIDVFEVFLYQSHSMEGRIILVQDLLVLHFRAFLINMPQEDLQDFEIIFLADGIFGDTKSQ